MATVGELIRTTREAKRPRLSQKALGKLVGVSRGAVSAWERNVDTPRHHTVPLLAEVLGLPEEAFNPNTAGKVNVGADSVPRDTIVVLEWSDLVLVHKHDASIRVPAGRKRMAVDAADLPYNKADCFALRLIDDSMEPTFHAGERVVFHRKLEPQDGDSVCVRLANGDHIFRHYKARGRKAFDLVAENAEHFQTVTVNAKSPGEVIGVLVLHERKIRRGPQNDGHRK